MTQSATPSHGGLTWNQRFFLASGNLQCPDCCPRRLPANGEVTGQKSRFDGNRKVGPIAGSIRLRARSGITLFFFLIRLIFRCGALAPQIVIKTRSKSQMCWYSLLLVGGGTKTILPQRKKYFSHDLLYII